MGDDDDNALLLAWGAVAAVADNDDGTLTTFECDRSYTQTTIQHLFHLHDKRK